ncbi:P-loop containing nucleoside triphosphate hydrolase protein [Tribonema minus]|uniref:RNA helicase n=1 Tax=Tribonema minus TaxID=303371 RepID=A0A835ZP19_9STRA|nr:P-loop containing nucleoside triphosphate hydrolase protein [Tribonema minus]
MVTMAMTALLACIMSVGLMERSVEGFAVPMSSLTRSVHRSAAVVGAGALRMASRTSDDFEILQEDSSYAAPPRRSRQSLMDDLDSILNESAGNTAGADMFAPMRRSSAPPRSGPGRGGGGGGGSDRFERRGPVDAGEKVMVDLSSKAPVDSKDVDDKTVEILRSKGIEFFTPVQSVTYEHILGGRDIVARSRTGTGKTIAFGLPVIQHLGRFADDADTRTNTRGRRPRFLVVCPTRELAKQVADELSQLARPHNLQVECFYGGSSYGPQESALRRGLDIVVGTPGRLIDHINKGNLDLSELKHAVLDEADEMLNMGFADDIEEIFSKVDIPACQVLLFSATVPDWVKRISAAYLKNPLSFIALLKTHNRPSCTYAVQVLHGDIGQNQREVTIGQFRKSQFQVLVATDVAARGIDISEIDLVVQYRPPTDPDTYVHRSGRTGRAGRSGVCVTLYADNERRDMQKIERAVGKGFKFERAPVPSPAQVMEVAGTVALKSLTAVSEEVVPFFSSAAKELIAESTASEGGLDTEKLLARCLAAIARKTELQQRSMLTGEPDMATVQLTAHRPLTAGDVMFAVDKLAREGVEDYCFQPVRRAARITASATVVAAAVAAATAVAAAATAAAAAAATAVTAVTGGAGAGGGGAVPPGDVVMGGADGGAAVVGVTGGLMPVRMLLHMPLSHVPHAQPLIEYQEHAVRNVELCRTRYNYNCHQSGANTMTCSATDVKNAERNKVFMCTKVCIEAVVSLKKRMDFTPQAAVQ